MSVSAPIPAGVVSKIEGSVGVIRAGGKTASALKVGDALQQGDAVIAAVGASLQLAVADGQLWMTPADGLPVGEALSVGEGSDVAEVRATLLAQGQTNLDEAIARLNQTSEEDAPAAGLSGGATGALGEGLRVGRVQESVGAQEFEFGTALVDPATEPFLSGTINGEATANAAPVIDPTSPNYDPASGNFSVTTDEDQPVSGQVLASDPEGGALTYATGTGPANGSVTVNPDGTWTYQPKPDYNGSDSFTVTVTDPQGGATTVTVNVGVNAVNDAPVANPDSLTAVEDTAATYSAAQLLGNDTDIDSTTLSIASVTAGKGGSVVLNADGTVTFTPNADFTGAADFTYTVSDGSLTSEPATVTVNVAAVNDLPVIDPNSPNYNPNSGNYSVTTDEDQPVSGQVLASDPEGGALTYATGTGPANGSVTVNPDGTWTYQPKPDYNGSDSFTVTVTDPQGGTTTVTINVGITPVDDATVVVNDTASVDEDSAVVIDVLANDADIDSAKSPVASITQGSNGTVVINTDGTLIYTPKANFSGADSFTYTNAEGNTATVNVTVNPLNDKPVVDPTSPNYNPNTGNYSVTTDEDQPVSGKVLASDADGDTLSYAPGTPPTNGSVTVNPDGTWTYQPKPDYNGSDSFTVTVTDPQGGTTTVTINVGITPVDDATVVVNDTASVDEDSAVVIDVLANDADIDSAKSPVASITQGSNGTVVINTDGTLIYTPKANFSGADSFTYTNAEGNTATVNVTVNPLNDKPVVDPTSPNYNPNTGNYSVTTDEDQPVSGKVLASDADGDTLSYAPGTPPTNGSVTVGTDGAWTYTPNPDYNGSDSFTVTVTDPQGGATTVTVNVGVNAVNDAPVANPDSLTAVEDTAATYSAAQLLGNDTDIDSTTLSIASVTAGKGGSVVLNADGTVTFTPNADFTGVADFTYTVSDGALTSEPATVTVNVAPVNDLPVIDPNSPNYNPNSGNYSVTTDEDQPVSGQVLASDPEGGALSYAAGTGPSNGSVTVNPDGTWTYQPKPDYNGSDSFTVTVTDPQGGATTVTVNVGITPVDDATVVAGDTASVDEDSFVIIDVLANDSDIDSAKSPVASVSQGSNGTVAINADGTLTYTPKPNFSGADSFTYTNAEGNTATVSVTVKPINDVPVVNDPSSSYNPTTGSYSVTTDEDTPVSGKVIASDADGDALSYAPGTQPTNGTVSVNPDGTWTYQPNPDYNGNDSFTVTVSDSKGGTTTVTVNVGITPVDDATVVAGDTASVDEDRFVIIDVLANDSDIDSTKSPVASVSQGSNGTVVINADGTLTYTPKPNFSGADSFTYTNAEGNTATVSVTVKPINDAPVVNDPSSNYDPASGSYSVTTPEDQPVSGQVVASDADGDALSYAPGTQPTNGTVSVNPDGTWTYQPNPDYNGSDSFTVTVSDSKGGTTTVTVNVGITPVNDAPIVTSDSATILEDTVATGNVLSNDSDVEGSALTVTQFSVNGTNYAAGSVANIAAAGTITINSNGDYTFTPAPNWSGSVPSVIYTAADGSGTSTGLLALKVTPVADVPTINAINNIHMLLEGNTTISTGASDTTVQRYEEGAGVSQANLELELGVASGYLDNRFDPKGLNVTDPGFVNIIDGKVSESHFSLHTGTTVTWDYSFTNGEDDTSEVSRGFNDVVVLLVTDPLGNKQSILVDSSEAKFPQRTSSSSFSYTSTMDGSHTFQWLVLNSGDSYKDSSLSLNNLHFKLAGDATRYTVPVELPIIAALRDTDGSEALTVTIGGVPAGIKFDAGTNNGDGTWTFTAAQIADLHLLAPENYQGTLNLTVTATSTETATGETASASQNFSVTIAETTNTYTTSGEDSQTINGTSSNDLLRGYAGNDTINAGAGNDIAYGGAGADTLNGDAGNDVLYGGVGNDKLNGGLGHDKLVGGKGNDTLTGGDGNDVFRWEFSDAGTAGNPYNDVITDFNTAALSAGGDVLDLRDLLQGELHAGTNVGNLDSFLRFETVGSNTLLHISSTGAYGSGGYTPSKDDQTITLQGVDLSNNNSLTSDQIIQNLLAAGKLITD
ncbi:MAG: Ig-like domain-containing protein [Aquabacterium sp.]|jgi:VCBS repeat-containing protein|uniref:tandem-95 repeat protein n=1 Tax=Aquabacterium sp. TaxID=1872578 RepID=UPI002A36358E|nr:Ig-like domain-containing protein [Aquabacterium sp.]MDX9843479.1 Ig-like domain-containing protein [Aquabacterium sp.]